MKKIQMLSLILLSFSLSACVKEETHTFAETTYSLAYISKSNDYDDLYILNDFTMRIEIIAKEEYESSEYNVLASRYNDEYYKVAITLIIEDTVYDNIEFHENKGSLAYNNRYFLLYDFTFENDSHKCALTMDLQNHTWINDFEDYRANSIWMAIDEIELNEKYKPHGYVGLYRHIAFSLESK